MLRQCRERITSGAYDIVIMDEMTYCFKFGWLDIDEVLDVLRSRPPEQHIIITGRDAPTELVEYADLVTEMREIKHPYRAGIYAQPGIEFEPGLTSSRTRGGSTGASAREVPKPDGNQSGPCHRADGKLVNVARRPGHLFVCSLGCCCGHTEHGFAPVPTDLYHAEWERRKLRPHVHLSIGGCLGPCPLANVVMLLFDGRSIWFHSMSTEAQVLALYDYLESLVAAQTYLPPSPQLAALHFNPFDWDI